VRLLTINAQIEKEDAYFTDDNGRYTARTTPGSRVFAYARDTTGPWQPCLASAVVNSYGVAVTQTDEGGRFFLCRANAPVWMGVSSRQEWFQLISGTGDSFFEIELRR
jgi:hypothetical protein